MSGMNCTVEDLVGHIRHCRDVARNAWVVSRRNTTGNRRAEIEQAFDKLFMALTDTERVAEDVPNAGAHRAAVADTVTPLVGKSGGGQ
jgi:hypothetical protein